LEQSAQPQQQRRRFGRAGGARPDPLARLDRIPSDDLGHVGGALAPVILLNGAYDAWGFSSALLIMAISGFVASGLILMGIQATGRSLEVAAAE
jgi:hypothetical protein